MLLKSYLGSESPSTIDHVSKYDVLINNAHSNFEQTIFTYKIFELWKYDPSKIHYHNWI